MKIIRLLHVSTPNVSSSWSLLCYLAKLRKYNCSSCSVHVLKYIYHIVIVCLLHFIFEISIYYYKTLSTINRYGQELYNTNQGNALFYKLIFNFWYLLHVECLNYLGSMLTNDGRCTREIKSRIAMAKVAFNKKKFITLLTSTRHIFIYLPNVKFLYEIFRLYLMPVHILALLGMLPY